jgi:hypothetical protein
MAKIRAAIRGAGALLYVKAFPSNGPATPINKHFKNSSEFFLKW